ncbi:MAG: GTP cyclohydrolase I FolE [Bdellovibrionota bacterium]
MSPAQYSAFLAEIQSGPTSRDPSKVLWQRAGEAIIQGSGEDPKREGLDRTPERFAKAMKHLFQGYDRTAPEAIGEGVFPAEGPGLITVSNIEFYSLCEHHFLPFWGTASVAYYPGKKILGLSKIPRIIEVFARRMQVQERLTRQIVEAVDAAVAPRAVAVKVRASHLCMMMRGVEKQSSTTATEYSQGLDQLPPDERSRLWESLK